MLGVGANTSVGGCLSVSCEDAHCGLKESETEVILIGNAQVEQTKKNTRLGCPISTASRMRAAVRSSSLLYRSSALLYG